MSSNRQHGGCKATSFYDHADDRLVVLEKFKNLTEMSCLECWMEHGKTYHMTCDRQNEKCE